MSLAALFISACAPVRGGAPDRNAPAPPPLVLDDLLAQTWRARGISPAPEASDSEFVRRVTLDLVGRIPTMGEVKAFLAYGAPDKRARLVDRLLASHEFAEHWGDMYADLLFGQEGKGGRLERKYDPAAWLVQAFDENLPYDRMAFALLTARGDVRENGAVAFIASRLRGGGGPEAIAGASARIFLGLQIQCAQCHDHPYDPRWKQPDFYGLTAFFARARLRDEKVEDAGKGMLAMAGPGMVKPKMDRTLVLFEDRAGEAVMRAPGSEEGVTIRPRFLGAEIVQRPYETRRSAVARAIIDSDLFAKAMVGRTWAQLFGHGLVDPWDDLGGENDPRHPPLLRALAQDFVASHYDIKRLIRTIVLSPAYERSSVGGSGGEGDAVVRAFARSGVRPLAHEPLFRSLVVATGAEAVLRRKKGGPAAPEACNEPPGSPTRRGPKRMLDLSPCPIDKRLGQAFREYQFAFGDDEMAEADRFDGSMPQALLLMNGELTNEGARAAPGGVLDSILAARPDPEGRLANMFLAVYARAPRDDERQRLTAFLREHDNSRAAYEDLYFALLTSTEAITNH